jgi:hypothetical protein
MQAARSALAVVVGAAALAVGACGGGSADSARPATNAAPPLTAAAMSGDSAPAPRCRAVPRPTVRLIASHAGPRTRFDAGAAAAVKGRSGYAVSVVAIAGGTQRMGTWFVDRLRAPEVVTSGNLQALRITNWPLASLPPELARQSGICAAKRLRGPAR